MASWNSWTLWALWATGRTATTLRACSIDETELPEAVIELVHVFGWPDLTLVRERVVFAELNSDRGALRCQHSTGGGRSTRPASSITYGGRRTDTAGVIESLLRSSSRSVTSM